MKRLLTEKLVEWKNSRYRKPLILWGARQVGKTWLMKDFGAKYFENCVYFIFTTIKEWLKYLMMTTIRPAFCREFR